MKKYIILSAFLFTATLFAQNDKKDIYIREHLPLLEKNLSTQEYNDFKKSMKFDRKGRLEAQDFDLLKKGSGDKFGIYYQYIITKITGKSYPITLVDQSGREMVIETDGTISFNNTDTISTVKTHNSQIEGNNILSYANEKFDVEKLITEDGLFIVTSTTCGPCVKAYEALNELSKENTFTNTNFTALYRDSFEKINIYKEGTSYKRFGELSSPWNIFSSDELIEKYNTNYDFKGFPYVFIRKKGKIVYQKYGIKIDEIRKHLHAS